MQRKDCLYILLQIIPICWRGHFCNFRVSSFVVLCGSALRRFPPMPSPVGLGLSTTIKTLTKHFIFFLSSSAHKSCSYICIEYALNKRIFTLLLSKYLIMLIIERMVAQIWIKNLFLYEKCCFVVHRLCFCQISIQWSRRSMVFDPANLLEIEN